MLATHLEVKTSLQRVSNYRMYDVCMYGGRYCTLVFMHVWKFLHTILVCMYLEELFLMYVCMCRCIYICMYVSLHTCVYVCMYVYKGYFTFEYMYVCMYVCMNIVCMYVCVSRLSGEWLVNARRPKSACRR